jgi:putative NADH-flavin reductase
MRLTIFGATGNTGRELVRQGLAQGHQLTCLVRQSATAKLPAEATLVQGSIFDPATVAKVIAGSEAVLSALGARSLRESDLLDRAITNILSGMKQTGVHRIIVLGAAGAVDGAMKLQSGLDKFVLAIISRTLLRNPFIDQAAQERRLKESDVGYTIVRPPRLTNGPHTGRYRVQGDSLPKAAKSIARADVADFMLDQLHDANFVRRGVYIAR